jgi:AcrR family transcriptional regulator
MVRARAKGESYHHGDLRRAVMEEAVAIVRKEGVAAVSLREIARRLGVSPGAPHHHFAEKDDLFAAIAEDAFVRIVARVGQRLEQAVELGARERLRLVCETYLACAMSDKARYAIMFLPQLRDRKRFASLHETGGTALATLAAAFHEAGTPAPRARAQAIACWATLHGFAQLANDEFLEETGGALRTLAEQVVEHAIGR